jgi:hypothetical protein
MRAFRTNNWKVRDSKRWVKNYSYSYFPHQNVKHDCVEKAAVNGALLIPWGQKNQSY